MKFTVGSIVLTQRRSSHILGLVVDQKAGLKWLQRDPFIDYVPDEADRKTEYVVVRYLSFVLDDCLVGKSVMPEEEPDQLVTIRWGYAQENISTLLAGPDSDSIERFLNHGYTLRQLGAQGRICMHDLKLIIEYLRGTRRTREEMSLSEHKFFKMLEEVLPK